MKYWIRRTSSKRGEDNEGCNGIESPSSKTELVIKDDTLANNSSNYFNVFNPFRGKGRSSEEVRKPVNTTSGEQVRKPVNTTSGEQMRKPVNTRSGVEVRKPVNTRSGEEVKKPAKATSDRGVIGTKNGTSTGQNDDEEKRNGSAGIIDAENDDESSSSYMSKKLLIRRLIFEELKNLEPTALGRGEDDQKGATIDSWSEMEESFIRIYEPVPTDVGMDMWSAMSKEEIIANIYSHRLKSEFETLQRSEILIRLQDIKDRGLPYFMRTPGNHPAGKKKVQQLCVDAEVHRQNTFTNHSGEVIKIPPKRLKNVKMGQTSFSDANAYENGNSNSWKSSTDEEPSYISRSEILSRCEFWEGVKFDEVPSAKIDYRYPVVSRNAILNHAEYTECESQINVTTPPSQAMNARNFPPFSRSRMLSRLCGIQNGISNGGESNFEDMPSSSCLHIPSLHSNKKDINQNTKGGRNVLWKILQEQEMRLRNFLSEEEKRVSNPSTVVDSESCSEEDRGTYGKRMRMRRSQALKIQNRVEQVLSNSRIETPTRETVMKIIRDHIAQNVNVDSMDEAELKNKEVRQRLKEVLADDWEDFSSISLGFIYVPMENNAKTSNSTPRDGTDYDTFGSLDSLIFQPKSCLSPVGHSSTNGDENTNAPYPVTEESSAVVGNCVQGQKEVPYKAQNYVNNILFSKEKLESEDGYHPDHYPRCLDSCTGSCNDSSDTDSVTSVESVIENKKVQENAVITRKTKCATKKYVVNRGTESDSNSDRNGSHSTHLLDSDTSWDYVETSKHKSSSGRDHETKKVFPSCHPFLFPSSCNDHAAKRNSDDRYYELCNENIVLLKHKLYESLESLLSFEMESRDGSGSTRLERSNNESVYGSDGLRMFTSMNGAYVDSSSESQAKDESPFVISNGMAIPLTEELFRSTSELTSCKDSNASENYEIELPVTCETKNPDNSAVEIPEPASVDNENLETVEDQSFDETDLKMKKVQKYGVSIMGTEKNDLMIRELKLKLKGKFSPDEGFEEESSLPSGLKTPIGSSRSSCNFNADDCNSMARKKKLLASHIAQICRERMGEIANSELELEIGKDLNEEICMESSVSPQMHHEPVSTDTGSVWVPTPDYTPLSTLPRYQENCDIHSSETEDVLNSYLDDLEGLVREQCNPQGRSEVDPGYCRNRSVRFATTPQRISDPTLGATWSDMESVIFAADRSLGSDESDCPNVPLMDKLLCNRMESYKDSWLLWDQLSKMRQSRTPEDIERWQSEKTKRMLLWINLSEKHFRLEWFLRSRWWKAKQRASVAWIVQKAHKNKVPSDLEEPYYKDYDGLERLKPGIVHRLSNADLYCSALANIYGDPNFHNLSHWNIIQALARKGVYVAEPTDVALTETVLIQTTPIKITAHLAVIEAMMALYIREVVEAERVVQAIQRISGASHMASMPSPQDQEEALVLWVEHTTQALQGRIHQHLQSLQGHELPVFPKIQDLSDLSDGIGLAALIAFYCPQELSWEDIAVADPPSMADSLYNIGLVTKFCHESLPYNPCLLTKEDIVYMHSSVKQNILAFISELFFLLELEPVSCVNIANTRRSSAKFIQLASPGCSGRYSSGSSGWSGYLRSKRIPPDSRRPISPTSTPSAHSTHSTASSNSSTHSHHRHRSSHTSSLRGENATRGKGLERQLSFTVKDKLRKDQLSLDGSEEGIYNPFNWESVYPPWWWSCDHKGNDKDCHYCLRQRQSQAFADQFQYYLSTTKTSSSLSSPSSRERDEVDGQHSLWHLGAGGCAPQTFYPRQFRAGSDPFCSGHQIYGDGQGISYTLPVRDWGRRRSKPPPSVSQTRPSSLRRARNPGWANYNQGVQPAGLPSVRRSHSMNLNDVNDSRSRTDCRSENAFSSQNSEYGGRESSLSDGQDGEFLVQKAKGFATLSEMMRHDSPRSHQQDADMYGGSRPNTKEGDKEYEDRRESYHGSITNLNELPPAGLPSRLEQRHVRRSRSRKNSINAEESQLTIENFGGSQDNLDYVSRNPDKEPYSHSGKKGGISEPSSRRSLSQTREELRSRDFQRSSLSDLDHQMVDKLERERERREIRSEHPASSSGSEASYDPGKPVSKATSFAELSKLKEQLPSGINIIYMQSDKDDPSRKSLNRSTDKKTSFSTPPNQTTWKQQSAQINVDDHFDPSADDGIEPQVVSSELHNVRLKLEEKRRRIATEKRKVELAMSKQRLKLGKEAFMQAVVKGSKTSSGGSSTPSTMSEKEPALELIHDSIDESLIHSRPTTHNISKTLSISPTLANQTLTSVSEVKLPPSATLITQSNPVLLLKDLGTEVSSVSRKWLENEKEELRTPDVDAMDYDDYQKSLLQMTDSLTEIQSDIHRLSNQQQQIQCLMQNGMSSQQQNQFYLHDQHGSPSRRMWSQPPGSEGYNSMSPATRRAHWGPPARPMVQQGEYMVSGPQQPPSGYYQYHMNQGQGLPHLNQPPGQLLPPLGQQQQHSGSFVFHNQPQSLPVGHQPPPYQNGQRYFFPEQNRGYSHPSYLNNPSKGGSPQGGNTPFRLHHDECPDDSQGPVSLRSGFQSFPNRQGPYQRLQNPTSPASRQVTHAPVTAPPPDDMEPQNVYFIEHQQLENSQEMNEKLKNMSIASGNRTYRILHEPGSPTRPPIGAKTFRLPTKKGTPVYDDVELPQPSQPPRSLSPFYPVGNDAANQSQIEPLMEDPKAEKGFYISLDDADSSPKRLKPPLRTKKLSQRKNSTPQEENAPQVYFDQPNSSGRLGLDSNYGSLKFFPGSSNRSMASSMTSHILTPRSGPAPPSPSSMASSGPTSQRIPSGYWDEPRETVTANHSGPSDESRLYRVSDSGSDLAPDDTVSLATKRTKVESKASRSTSLVIGEDLVNENSSLSEMEKKKERLMMMSMRRKQQQEEMRRKKEMESEQKREEDKTKEDMRMRKKDDERMRREIILERYKVKKAIDEAEKEGRNYTPPSWYGDDSTSSSTPGGKMSSVRLRNRGPGATRPRPKTMHETSFSETNGNLSSSRGKKGSSHNVAGESNCGVRKISNKWGSSGSLARATGSRGSTGNLGTGPDLGTASLSRGHSGRRPVGGPPGGSLLRRDRSSGTIYGSRDVGLSERAEHSYQVHEPRRTSVACTPRGSSFAVGSTFNNVHGSRKYRSTGNLYGEHDSLMYHMSEDSGLGTSTPSRRAPSPGMSSKHLPSPCGPGSLPPGLFSRRRQGLLFDDNMSDISATSSNMDYCGPRLFKLPMAKSNRHLILNAVEYCVFPGVVNQTAKQRVLEEVARSDAKHFLILFRDSGCQFRALYSYNPDLDEVFKLYGTGPKQITDRMFDKFFKYNSGGKCFSQIHTKHLTVTIDAFTIHNCLWQGKKVNLPLKKDTKLVI